MIIFSLICIFLAFLCCYLTTHKKKTQRPYIFLNFFNHRPYLCRIFACFFYLLATLLLSKQYHFSVGFISFWIFASPILFVFILSINHLSSQKSK